MIGNSPAPFQGEGGAATCPPLPDRGGSGSNVTPLPDQRTLAKAEAIGIRHMLTFTNRWLPHYLALKRLLDDGYIGQPFHAYFHWPTGWGRYHEDKYHWYYDSKRAHGALSELGAHIIDLAYWDLGDVTRVTANLAAFGKRLAPDGSLMTNPANDSAFLILEFANGAHASLHNRCHLE